MNDQEFDALLRSALMDANLQDFQAPLSQEDEIHWSSRYLAQRKKRLADPWRWYRNRARPVWKKTLRSAACLLLACSLGFCALMAGSPTVRAAVVQWIQEIYETHIIYRFQGMPTNEEMPEYRITALPEGFEEADRVGYPGFTCITYQNEQNANIYLECVRRSSGAATMVSTDNMEVSDISVNGLPGQFYQALDGEDSNTIIWFDESVNIQFSIDAHNSKSEILHMAEGLELVKLPN